MNFNNVFLFILLVFLINFLIWILIMINLEQKYKRHTVEWDFYKDSVGEHRWRAKAANGKITGASTEGFKNMDDCVYNATLNGFKIDEEEL